MPIRFVDPAIDIVVTAIEIRQDMFRVINSLRLSSSKAFMWNPGRPFELFE